MILNTINSYNNANGKYKTVLSQIIGIAKQEVNVYQMIEGDWAFANAGIMSDGFKTKELAEIAALKEILDAVILSMEAIE